MNFLCKQKASLLKFVSKILLHYNTLQSLPDFAAENTFWQQETVGPCYES